LRSVRSATKELKADFAIVAPKGGGIADGSGKTIEADFQLAGGSSVLFDAVFIAASADGAAGLAREAAAVAWVHDAYSHCKVIGATEASSKLLQAAGVVSDEGVILQGEPQAFLKAAANGRVWSREPKVRTIY
jgi:catalase